MYTLLKKEELIFGKLRNNAGLVISFLENGSILSINYDDVMINQLLASPIEGGVGNLYIRIHKQDGISFFPLIGPASNSSFELGNKQAVWRGEENGCQYNCAIQLEENRADWYFTVDIFNNSVEDIEVDIVFAQDLGIAAEDVIRTNELYTSHYIDHQIYMDSKLGYVICSRQNQSQNNKHPWIMMGCLNEATGYLTDGYQFYGLTYKESNIPDVLTKESLPNSRYQYEFAMPALKSKSVNVECEGDASFVFFSNFVENHKEITSEKDLDILDDIKSNYFSLKQEFNNKENLKVREPIKSLFNKAELYHSNKLSDSELTKYFGCERRNEEIRNGKLLSFFYGDRNHVVLKDKELITERAHGHIMRSGSYLAPNDNILSITSWMYGVFGSHVAVGNTNYNKMITPSRNGLNVFKSSGQRIFVKRGEKYELLAMPSAFEMNLNGARWIYKGKNEIIIVRVWTSMKDSACFLDIYIEGDNELQFIISNNIIAGNLEYDTKSEVTNHGNQGIVAYEPNEDEFLLTQYKESCFFVLTKDSVQNKQVGGSELLFSDSKLYNLPYIVFETELVSNYTLITTGSVTERLSIEELEDKYVNNFYSYEDMLLDQSEYYSKLSNNPVISSPLEEVMKFNDLIPWYIHNSMIHYTSPHGLEQYSGAAWGLRDVCQGPVELLLATKHYEALRGVIKKIYGYQILQTGDWRQWFMIDRFSAIQETDSHNDIKIWPIKALCDYIEATGDFDILNERVPYIDEKTHKPLENCETIYEHTLKQIGNIRDDCIPETALIRYGHGDWEDTLQPTDQVFRDNLVSTWTVELVYQNLMRYRSICGLAGYNKTKEELTILCYQIAIDFREFLMKDGITVGLAYFGEDEVDYLLHPNDEKTGINYRLISINRGIISGLFTKNEAKKHLSLLKKHLLFPDGVRLMNKPMVYRGGKEIFFKRAETGANFGREIGLQYVHAHIRYLEALAKLGEAESLFEGLLTINQINIEKVVKKAMPRQSNCFFSSSDADFKDRYDASKNFEGIKAGTIGIKGGWRIYSSGPGIYLSRLILDFLGIKEYFDDICLDPVIPKKLSGLKFDYMYDGKKVRYEYIVEKRGYSPYKVLINGKEVDEPARYSENPYRKGGRLISKRCFLNAFDKESNKVVIYL